jgi:hypothetical protein
MTIDLYEGSHARLRQRMREADLAVSAALDSTDNVVNVDAAARLVSELLVAMRCRSDAESRILHPIIGASLPKIREALDRQHALIAPLIDHVEAVRDAFVVAPSAESARMLAKAVRHFVDAVLPHMEEEEALVPLLTSTLAPEELAEAARALGAD